MNHKVVFSMVGLILRLESALLMLPLIVSAIYKEECVTAFAFTVILTLALGLILRFAVKPDSQVIFAKDGLVIVALAWVVMSLFGALPFYLSGEIPSYVDALFETVSGFTTTGASVVSNVETLSHGINFWRCFTHWLGGMGVIVFIMAIFPTESGRYMHIMSAEMPGHKVGKLLPRVKDTAKILYVIYIVLTVAETIFLVCGDMDLFESILHSFATAGTGGFGIKATSIGGYSAYSQWVITVFMLLFGVNFNLYFLILIGRVKSVFKSEELRMYLGIVAFSVVSIAINVRHLYEGLAETIRYSAFQVATVITTTGFSTTNFDLWPDFSKTLLFLLMFIGGCAGSTAGGLKVSRIFILFKVAFNNIKKIIHPKAVSSIQFEGKPIDDETKKGVSDYFVIYMGLFIGIFLLISLEPFGFETNISAVAACINNIGPGFSLVGPAADYSIYSGFSKIVLSLAMLLGRLELYPVLILLVPNSWSKKKSGVQSVKRAVK